MHRLRFTVLATPLGVEDNHLSYRKYATAKTKKKETETDPFRRRPLQVVGDTLIVGVHVVAGKCRSPNTSSANQRTGQCRREDS